MSYEYGGTLHQHAWQVNRASVEAWLYASGQNSDKEVAILDTRQSLSKLLDDVYNGNWQIPYKHTADELEEYIQQTIDYAQKRIQDN